jgi:membrane protein DedA with SNARE-associated domain
MAAPEIPAWLNTSKLSNFPLAAFFLIFFGTWFSEDGAMVASAILWNKGKLSWEVVYWGNVLGLTSGDILMYWLGYEIGFGLENPWVKRFIKPSLVEKGHKIFLKWGNWLVFIARFIPGLRVPAYSAAGLLRAPLGPVAAIIFLTAAFWVGVQMEIIQAAGNHLNPWEIFFLGLSALLLTHWVLSGFDNDGWKKRWQALKRVFRSGSANP